MFRLQRRIRLSLRCKVFGVFLSVILFVLILSNYLFYVSTSSILTQTNELYLAALTAKHAFLSNLETHSPAILDITVFNPNTFGKKTAIIQNVLDTQLRNSIWISIGLLVLASILSYFASGYLVRPLANILKKVDRVADIQFDDPLSVNRTDEFGMLAERVNVMSNNLLAYTTELRDSITAERIASMAYVGAITSSMIHELRSPITALKNFVALFPSIEPHLKEDGKGVMEHMKLATDHVNAIVNSFSDFLKHGKLNVGLHDVSTIIEQAMSLVEPLIAGQNIMLTAQDDSKTSSQAILVECDADKIRQVLLNLIKNAVDAIDSNSGRKEIIISLAEKDGFAQIDVRDTGCGIPKEKWKEVFTPFHSSNKSGFGLGLSICLFIVLSSGGMMEVADSNASGTVMRIYLPIASVTTVKKRHTK